MISITVVQQTSAGRKPKDATKDFKTKIFSDAPDNWATAPGQQRRVSKKQQLFLCNKICESCRRFANFGLKVSKYRRIWNVTSLALKDWQTKHLQGVAQVSSASKRLTKLAIKSFKSRDNTSKYYTRTWLEVKTGRCFRHSFLAKITWVSRLKILY